MWLQIKHLFQRKNLLRSHLPVLVSTLCTYWKLPWLTGRVIGLWLTGLEQARGPWGNEACLH